MIFANRLTEMRNFTNPHLRQKDVAKILNMTQRKVSRLERGDTQPTTEEIAKICKFYDISADYLLGLIDTPKSYK